MKSFNFVLFLLILAFVPGCGKEETVANTQTFPISPELSMDQGQVVSVMQILDPMNGVQTGAVFPAEGTNPSEVREVKRSYFTKRPTREKVGEDVLKGLDVTIVNEFDNGSTHRVSEDDIRGIADVAYARTGILNNAMRGWTLTVRMSTQGPSTAQTQLFEKQKRAVIEIDPVTFEINGPHEMAHFLVGNVLYENKLPGFLYELMSIAAENPERDPNLQALGFEYEAVNKSILGFGKTLDHKDSVIHAQNSPFDGLRYDLLRAAKKKIGVEAYRELAEKVYQMGLESTDTVTLEELQPLFADYSLGDLVLLQKTQEPGIYVDIVFTGDGTPLILTKQINDLGVEGSFMSSFTVAMKQKGELVATMMGTTNPGGIITDPTLQFQSWWSDQIDILVGTTTYTYKIVDDDTEK